MQMMDMEGGRRRGLRSRRACQEKGGCRCTLCMRELLCKIVILFCLWKFGVYYFVWAGPHIM